MPLSMVHRIVIDAPRRAECAAAIGAAHEHHVAASRRTGRLNAREHVDVVIGAGAGTIDDEKNLPNQSFGINRFPRDDVSAEIHSRASVESWYDKTVLCIG